jgi:adenine-specific DNA methylase
MAKCDRNNDCLLITFFKKTGYLRVYIKNDQAYIIPEDLLYEDYTFNDKYIVSSNGKEIFILKVDKLNKVGEEQKK